MSWEKIKALKEKQGTLREEMQAIISKATDETRALTDEEGKEFDAKEKEFEALGDTIKRLESMPKVEDTTPQNLGRDRQPGDSQADRPLIDRVMIPATVRKSSNLKAFIGPKANAQAYIAGQFVAATVLGVEASQQWCRDHGINIRNAMSEGTTTAGGYLTPVEVEEGIIRLVEQYGVARRNARIVPMGSDTKNVPVREGGLTTYYVGEGVAITPSDMIFGNVELVAKKLAALAVYSSELGEDALVDLGDTIVSEIGRAFALAEDQAFFNGDGTASYGGQTGIINALNDGAIVTAAAGNTSFGELDLQDYEDCVGAFPNYAGAQPKWYISKPGFAASMLSLMNAAGGNTNQTLSGGVTPQFMGYDVEFVNVMPKTTAVQASTIVAIFADLQLSSIMGTRRGITISRSTEFRFAEDQLAIKGTERFCINIHSKGVDTTAGDGDDAGAIVALQTPSS